MKHFSVKDIFEAEKFVHFFGKLVNFVFITISQNGGFYSPKTTKTDKMRFIFGFSFAIYIIYDNLMVPLKKESRSLVFEIFVFFNGKFMTTIAPNVMLQTYFRRHEYFKIKNFLHWIDGKVIL